MQQAQNIGRWFENKPQWNKLWIDHFPSCAFAMPSISIDEWWSDRLTPFTDQKNHFGELENKDGFISAKT